MKHAPGYPLPDGELGEDEIVCQLVYLPDRPEYWQAFLGALSYMSTWRAWERDDDKRGKEAAANWREAFELTMECWRMTCLEDLKADVAAILAVLEAGAQCCDEQDYTDGDRYTDRVEDGEGDVPQPIIDAGYAEDSEDWAGFDDYKCMISHVIVDQLPAKILKIVDIADETGGYLGGLAAIAAIVAVIVGTGGLAIVFGIVAGIGATALLYESLTGFPLLAALADKVVENHDALACSVYLADGDVGALVALNDKIDEVFTVPEALILKSMNLGPTLKALYSGRYDQQDIADTLQLAGYELDDFDCACFLSEAHVLYDFNDEVHLDRWSKVGGTLIEHEDTLLHYPTTSPQTCVIGKSFQIISIYQELGWDGAYLRRIQFKYMWYDDLESYDHNAGNWVGLYGTALGESEEELFIATYGSVNKNQWYTVDLQGVELLNLNTLPLEWSQLCLRFKSYFHDVSGVPTLSIRYDDIHLWLDEV